jgi:serine/threonine protein kinase
MGHARKVSHPNVTETYDAGVIQGVYYIAMEYIAGQSLFRLVATGGPLPVGRAAKLFAQAAAGLEHAHEIGLIHRDLKPSNIMVTPRDQVKVLDLGLALMEGEVAEEQEVIGGKGYVVGTMDYIAPEQTEDAAAVDARADLYGLGCALYYAVTGQPPFPGGDSKSKIRRHRREEPTPLAELNPLIPAGFAALVHMLLAKRPEDRPPSAAALRELLLPWADPLPPPPGSPAAGEMKPAEAELAVAAPAAEAGSAWDWIPPGSLAEAAGRGPRLPGWWADMAPTTRWLLLAMAALGVGLLAALAWWAAQG